MCKGLIAVLVALFLPLVASARDKKLVGGPCSYEEFAGYCTATGEDASGRGVFAFVGAVRERDVELPGNTMMEGMSLRSGSMPCKLEFIQQGTCTPCVFSIGECGGQAWEVYREMPKPKKKRGR